MQRGFHQSTGYSDAPCYEFGEPLRGLVLISSGVCLYAVVERGRFLGAAADFTLRNRFH